MASSPVMQYTLNDGKTHSRDGNRLSSALVISKLSRPGYSVSLSEVLDIFTVDYRCLSFSCRCLLF